MHLLRWSMIFSENRLPLFRIMLYAQPMSARSVRIGRSATGLGLFAAKAIERNAYIVTYRGKRIPTREAHERERRFGAKYMFELNRRWTIDGSSRRNLGRYINHSCRPNAEAVMRNGRIVFVALRGITPGEEVTLDYGEEYFDLFLKDVGCRCAACMSKAARRRARR
jgi:SET domain-containing protein